MPSGMKDKMLISNLHFICIVLCKYNSIVIYRADPTLAICAYLALPLTKVDSSPEWSIFSFSGIPTDMYSQSNLFPKLNGFMKQLQQCRGR